MKRFTAFLKNEIVLTVALLMAVISAFAVPPDMGYIEYIDWDMLFILFSLMAVMSAFKKMGAFDLIGGRLLNGLKTSRQLLFVLVFLPFVFSMFITNDVALITFVPFGFIVLKMAGCEKYIVPAAVLQTVGANLGSMLTPIGNPQNLYLFGKSGLGIFEFVGLTAPYVIISGILIASVILFIKNVPVRSVSVKPASGVGRGALSCSGVFIFCLLSVADIVPPSAAAAVSLLFLILWDRKLVLKIDYSLLLTFAAFFVFIGNMGRIEEFRSMINAVLTGREVLASAAVSQVISNVPAALLMSGFTDKWNALIIGCNLGGLGILIASMASLISYKQISVMYPGERKKYILWFTLCNIALLALLLAAAAILGDM